MHITAPQQPAQARAQPYSASCHKCCNASASLCSRKSGTPSIVQLKVRGTQTDLIHMGMLGRGGYTASADKQLGALHTAVKFASCVKVEGKQRCEQAGPVLHRVCVPAVQVGDGTTTVVILSGELLRAAKPFVEEGVHPRVRSWNTFACLCTHTTTLCGAAVPAPLLWFVCSHMCAAWLC